MRWPTRTPRISCIGALTPDTIIVTPKGNAKIDFDLGVCTRHRPCAAGRRARYWAPEQMAGAAGDHRVDIYALGLVLFEMLTGGVPRAATAPQRPPARRGDRRRAEDDRRRPDAPVRVCGDARRRAAAAAAAIDATACRLSRQPSRRRPGRRRCRAGCWSCSRSRRPRRSSGWRGACGETAAHCARVSISGSRCVNAERASTSVTPASRASFDDIGLDVRTKPTVAMPPAPGRPSCRRRCRADRCEDCSGRR